MPIPVVTVEEFIETLKRSSLPTVVTEGSDDYKFYRRVEEGLSSIGVSLFPVGGRLNVLEIFKRRRDIGRNNVIFLADKDLWIFDGVPAEFSHRKIILTSGYSIENELYCDGDIENFLDEAERRQFNGELLQLLEWYSFAVASLLANVPGSISDHPNQVLDETGNLNQSHMAAVGFAGKHNEIFDLVRANYRHLLRGKNLIELIMRQLSAKRRGIKFGRNQIMEIGSARRGAHMQRISDEIGSVFQVL